MSNKKIPVTLPTKRPPQLAAINSKAEESKSQYLLSSLKEANSESSYLKSSLREANIESLELKSFLREAYSRE
jgi:hypothetical protein